MEQKENVSINQFEEALSKASPMPLYENTKKEKSSYDYFQELGESIVKSLKDGTSPLLPNKDGFVDLQPAYNARNNTKTEGLTQLMLLTKQKELNAPSAAFVTFESVKKAQEAGIDCKVMKGSKGVVVPVVELNDWKNIKFKNTWFNISQIENADTLTAFLKAEMTKQYEKDVEYINTHYPDSTYEKKKNPAEFDMAKENTKVIPLNEKTDEPYQYLAQVMNAVNTGRKLYVTPEQAEKFKTKAVEILTAEYEPGKLDKAAVMKLATAASHLYSKNKKMLQERSQKKEVPEEKKVSKKPRSVPSHEIGR